MGTVVCVGHADERAFIRAVMDVGTAVPPHGRKAPVGPPMRMIREQEGSEERKRV